MDTDPYADLSHLCGITAFSLPPRPRLRPSTDHHIIDPFAPIPDHLRSRYLCYDDPSPQLRSSSSPHHPLLLHSSSPYPNFTSQTLSHESLFSCNPDSPASGPRHKDSLLHQREIPPPCVVNYQDSLHWTPERESSSYSASFGVGDSEYGNWMASFLPSEINEMDFLASGLKDSAFTGGNGKRLLSHIKKLALWHEESEDIVSFMTSFRDFAFSTHCRKSSLQDPSRNKRRKHEAKSKGASIGVGDSDYENWVASLLPCEINEMALCDPNAERLVSVTKDSAFAGGYGKRLPSHIKKLALWHKDVTFMTSFSDFAFSSHGRKNSLKEPSRKKQRKHEVKSEGFASSFHFTRSKSANRLF